MCCGTGLALNEGCRAPSGWNALLLVHTARKTLVADNLHEADFPALPVSKKNNLQHEALYSVAVAAHCKAMKSVAAPIIHKFCILTVKAC